MEKSLVKYSIIGFIFVSILGTLSHFFYEWSGNSLLIGLFCPINESSWEHLKLIFFPYLIWTVIEYFTLGRKGGILLSKAIGVIAGIIGILVFFYTYTGITGRNIDALNILSYFIGVFIAFAVDYVLIKSGRLNKTSNARAIIIFFALALLFFVFAFVPPFVPIFRDPINFTYGI